MNLGIRRLQRFFGLPLGSELVAVIRQTPLDQLSVLAADLVGQRTGPPQFLNDAFIPDLFVLGTPKSLAELQTLKTLVMLCPRVVVEDPILQWAQRHREPIDGVGRLQLVRLVGGLVPLRKLIEADILLQIDCDNDDRFAWFTGRVRADDTEDIAHILADPVAARAALDAWPVEAWQFDVRDLDPARDPTECAFLAIEEKFGIDLDHAVLPPHVITEVADEIVRRTHIHATWPSLRSAARFADISRESGATPVATNDEALAHVTSALTGQLIDMVSISRVSRAAGLGIPSVRLLSWPDILSLRLSSEVYEDFRTELLDVIAVTLDNLLRLDDNEASLLVSEAASERLPPAISRIEREIRRSQALASATAAAPGLVLTIAQAVLGQSPPGGRSVAGRAGKVLSRRPAARARALSVARGLLMSLVEQGR